MLRELECSRERDEVKEITERDGVKGMSERATNGEMRNRHCSLMLAFRMSCTIPGLIPPQISRHKFPDINFQTNVHMSIF